MNDFKREYGEDDLFFNKKTNSWKLKEGYKYEEYHRKSKGL
jgi:hypothetical protein